MQSLSSVLNFSMYVEQSYYQNDFVLDSVALVTVSQTDASAFVGTPPAFYLHVHMPDAEAMIASKLC